MTLFLLLWAPLSLADGMDDPTEWFDDAVATSDVVATSKPPSAPTIAHALATAVDVKSPPLALGVAPFVCTLRRTKGAQVVPDGTNFLIERKYGAARGLWTRR